MRLAPHLGSLCSQPPNRTSACIDVQRRKDWSNSVTSASLPLWLRGDGAQKCNLEAQKEETKAKTPLLFWAMSDGHLQGGIGGMGSEHHLAPIQQGGNGSVQ